MKNLFYVLLAGTLLCACSGNNTENTSQEDTTQAQNNTESKETDVAEEKIDSSLPKYIFVSRQNGNVEKVYTDFDANMENVTAVFYEKNGEKPVELRILGKDEGGMNTVLENPTTQEQMKFVFNVMGISHIISDTEMQEFSPEVKCYAENGAILTTSGGPMFAPFALSENGKEPFTPLDLTEQKRHLMKGKNL